MLCGCACVRTCASVRLYMGICVRVSCPGIGCMQCVRARTRAGVRACMRVTYACECVYNRAWVGECTYMRMYLFYAHGHVVYSAMLSKGYIVMCSDFFIHTPISNTHPQAVFLKSKCTMHLICFKVIHTQC